jgi:hypothetical protein
MLLGLIILTRVWSSLLVLLIAVSLLSIAQTAQSQQYTTTTITSLITNTQSSTVAVATQTLNTTQAQSASIISAPFTIPGTHGICGIYFQQAFKGTAGSVLTGSLNSSSSVDLYVMTDSAFQAWSHQVVAGGTCTPSNPLLSQHNITAPYYFTTPIPADDRYQIIVNNLSHSTVTVQLNASLATTLPALVTTTMYSTLMQENVQTILQTTTQTVQSALAPTIDPVTIGIVVLILILIAIAAYVIVKRRSSNK